MNKNKETKGSNKLNKESNESTKETKGLNKLNKESNELTKETNELTKESITVWNAIIKNYLAWTVIFICICILSRENMLTGLFTFGYLFVCAYFIHLFSHQNTNIFNILHHYHHYANNYFSHYIQLSLELNIPIIFFPIYYFYNTIFFDIWTVIYSVILYSTIHNINYGYFHVNKVHSLHHENIFTNLGPDICDVMFDTKNEKDTDVEDVTHYIPNAIIIMIIILILQYICLNKENKEYLKYALIIFISSLTLINVVSSAYIYYYHANNISKKRNVNGSINYVDKIKNLITNLRKKCICQHLFTRPIF